jgi:hypothetical protein
MAFTLSELSRSDLSHVETARGFLELGLPHVAWDELGKVEPAARDTAETLALRAEILLFQERVEHARIAAEGAVKLHPGAARCYYALALVEAAEGNFSAVRESLECAFRASPEMRTDALFDARLTEFWAAEPQQVSTGSS